MLASKFFLTLVIAFLFIIFFSLIGVTAPNKEEIFDTKTGQSDYKNPQVIVNLQSYSVYGSTVEQIRESLRKNGILYEKDGQRYAGFTYWNVKWSYNYQVIQQKCQITEVNVITYITIKLPQWKIPSNTPNSLKLKWEQFISALTKHEEGHKKHGILAGQEIMKTLQQFPPHLTCQTLEKTAHQTAEAIIKKYSEADLLYDQKTQYGTTEGATF